MAGRNSHWGAFRAEKALSFVYCEDVRTDVAWRKIYQRGGREVVGRTSGGPAICNFSLPLNYQ